MVVVVVRGGVVDVVGLGVVVGSRVVEVVVVASGSHGSQGLFLEQGSTQHSINPVSGFLTG